MVTHFSIGKLFLVVEVVTVVTTLKLLKNFVTTS
jgi:hypothetical protein